MKIDWHSMGDRLYTAEAPGGSSLELQLGPDDAWYLFSPLPEHAGIDFLGDDLHAAMQLTAAMMDFKHKVDGWTVDGREQGPLWGRL